MGEIRVDSTAIREDKLRFNIDITFQLKVTIQRRLELYYKRILKNDGPRGPLP